MDKKKFIYLGIAFFAIVAAYEKYGNRIAEMLNERNNPKVTVQAVEILDTTMPETVILEGKLDKAAGPTALLQVDSESMGKCRKGMKASIRLGDSAMVYQGHVARTVQSGNGFMVVVPLPKELVKKESGTPLVGTLVGDRDESVLTVPWGAIDRREGNCVWVINSDDMAVKKPIKLGAYDPNIVSISGAIQKGDWVVLGPHDIIDEATNLDVIKIYQE